MVELAAGVARPVAAQAVRDANGNLRLATVMAKRKLSAQDARQLLADHGGKLREVLEA
jgi:N-acetylmuramic acid 6-phosphate (MurNAc-6-P) etherase